MGLRCKLICCKNLFKNVNHDGCPKVGMLIFLEATLSELVSISWNKITLVFDTASNKTQPFLTCFSTCFCPGVRWNVEYCNADFCQCKAFHVMPAPDATGRSSACWTSIFPSISQMAQSSKSCVLASGAGCGLTVNFSFTVTLGIAIRTPLCGLTNSPDVFLPWQKRKTRICLSLSFSQFHIGNGQAVQ